MARGKSKKKKGFEFKTPNKSQYGGLWPHQWAWEFLRRNQKYQAFYPECYEVYCKIAATHVHKEPRPGVLPYWEEFSQTKEYKKLKSEFGLIYPEDPNKPGKDVSIEIWAPEHVLDSIVMTDNDFDPKDIDARYQAFVLVDLRRPRIKQLEELDFFLRNSNCAEHTTHFKPSSFIEFLETYDVYKSLEREFNRTPTGLELAKILWPDDWFEIEQEVKRVRANKEKTFSDKPRYALQEAKKYIEQKGYLDILNWRPDEKKK